MPRINRFLSQNVDGNKMFLSPWSFAAYLWGITYFTQIFSLFYTLTRMGQNIRFTY